MSDPEEPMLDLLYWGTTWLVLFDLHEVSYCRRPTGTSRRKPRFLAPTLGGLEVRDIWSSCFNSVVGWTYHRSRNGIKEDITVWVFRLPLRCGRGLRYYRMLCSVCLLMDGNQLTATLQTLPESWWEHNLILQVCSGPK